MRRPKPTPAPQASTWPFADGYPWDEPLIRSGARALSTHGPAADEPLWEAALNVPLLDHRAVLLGETTADWPDAA